MDTMYEAKINSPITRLDGAIDGVQTTITVLDSSVLPPAPNLLTISSGNIEDDETCLYTDITGNVVTVTRGFESAAKPWADNSYVSRVFTAYDHNKFKRNITNVYDNYTKGKEPTGFTNPAGITQTYDSVTRTVTLTGDVELLFNGEPVASMVSGWTSPAHPENPTTGLFLKYTEAGGYEWQTTPWEFYEAQIFYVLYLPNSTFISGVRECHGTMPWQVHSELHKRIGTFRDGGGVLGNYVVNSTTATDRRPTISQLTVCDEDIKTILPEDISQNSYTHLYLSSADTLNFTTDNAEFLILSGGFPVYNQLSGGNYIQTALANNEYTSIWVFAIPSTADVQSQKYRFVYMMGQSVSTALATERALKKGDLNLTPLGGLATEFVFFAQIIVKREAGAWVISEVVSLDGSRSDAVGTSTNTNVSAGQVSYDGLISNIPATTVKTALDSLTLCTENAEVTTDYTLAYTDKSRVVVMNKTGDATVTVPTNASVPFPIGTRLMILNRSSADVYVVGDTGVTIHHGSRIHQHKEICLRKRDTNEWVTNDFSHWLDHVDTEADLDTVYPNAEEADMVATLDNLSIHGRNGATWHKIVRGKIARFSEFSLTAAQSIPISTPTLVAWTNVVEDVHNFQSGVNTRLIVPANISYVRISMCLHMDTPRRDRAHYAELRKNGTKIELFETPMSSGDTNLTFRIVSRVIRVVPTDYFEAIIYHVSDTAKNLLVSDTYIQVEVLV